MTTLAKQQTTLATHQPGHICWVELQSSDVVAAAHFYGEVLDWQYEELPSPNGAHMRIALRDAAQVAGLGPMSIASVEQGAASAWTPYILVEDAAATCRLAETNGARIAVYPTSVGDEGVVAIILDPLGAVIGLWQPALSTGAELLHEPSTMLWHEISTREPERTETFYANVFGWQAENSDAAHKIFYRDGVRCAGLYNSSGTTLTNGWTTYFGVDNIDEAVAAARDANGLVLAGPSRVGPGTGAAVQDPSGAMVVLAELDDWVAKR